MLKPILFNLIIHRKKINLSIFERTQLSFSKFELSQKQKKMLFFHCFTLFSQVISEKTKSN